MTKVESDSITPETDPESGNGNGDDGRALRRRLITVVITAILAAATYFLLPAEVNELARRTAAIFVVAAVFWATETLPLYATSLLIIAFLVLALASVGGLADVLPAVAEMPEQQISFTDFLGAFGSPIIILFMGGFLLSAAMSKHAIDRALASRFLQPLTKSPLRLMFGVLIMTAFFSMWMSNTATAAMMLAIIAPLLRSLPETDRFHRGLILAVPLGANIGGIGTPIGTPPNAIAFGHLNAGDPEFHITFLDWMMMAVPLEILLLTFVGFLLYWLYRPPHGEQRFKPIEPPGKMTRHGKTTLAVLIGAIALWLTGGLTGINPAIVALLAAVALTVFGVLGRKDVDSIDWNILILFWGGLALGHGMNASGLTDLVSGMDFGALPGGGWVIAAAIVAISVVMSTFMSNTATANLIVPIALALSVGGITEGDLAILAALACSFAMALPVSTPPNAIAFATGKLPAASLLRVGGFVSIVSVIVLLLGFQIMLPLILGFGQ